MTELIALLAPGGKGSWAEAAKLLNAGPWERVFLVTDAFGAEKFKADEKTQLVLVDFRSGCAGLCDAIRKKLSGKLHGLEVAVNLSSGSGNEHMALLAALMKLGAGFRLVSMDEQGLVEL